MRNFRHKSIAVLCLFMALCWNGISIHLAGAPNEGGSKHISTGKILEFSLKNLKESLQKTKQKNDRMSFENIALHNDIQIHKRKLEKLSLKKAKLTGKTPSVHTQEDQILFTEALDMKGREERTDELVAIFKRDVLALQEEIQLIDNHMDPEKFSSQKQLLLDKKHESRKIISIIEKRLKNLDKKNKGPQKIIKNLESEKGQLERKLSILRDRAADY